MKKIYFYILIIGILTTGCQTYLLQNSIGNPTIDLDKNKNCKTIKTNLYKPEEAYTKTRAILYSKKADVYLQNPNKILYARNLIEIFPFAINTTTIKFEFIEKNDYILIKLTSRNVELTEFFNDNLINLLVESAQENQKYQNANTEI